MKRLVTVLAGTLVIFLLTLSAAGAPPAQSAEGAPSRFRTRFAPASATNTDTLYLPLIAKIDPLPAPQTTTLGLAFVSSAEAPGMKRYQHALADGNN
jgi:hypothetical protein